MVVQAAAGRPNKEIAHELGISGSTVRVLLSRAMTKVAAQTRQDLFEKVAGLGPTQQTKI